MKARPILFSAPMIRALLDGRKTQTRRLAKFEPREGVNLGFSGIVADCLTPETWALVSRGAGGCWNERTRPLRCPYGSPGDLLWVRETWAAVWKTAFPPDDPRDVNIEYRADTRANYPGNWEDEEARGNPDAPKWRPSIFMPRRASRLTLELTDIRVERLRNISETDAIAEGYPPSCWAPDFSKVPHLESLPHGRLSAVAWYRALWDQINGAGAWNSNPWVWALSFRVRAANVDTVLAGSMREAAE